MVRGGAWSGRARGVLARVGSGLVGAVVMLGLVALAVGCAAGSDGGRARSGPTSGATAPATTGGSRELWAEGARQYVDAFLAALNEHREDRVLAFLAPEGQVSWVVSQPSRPAEAEGWVRGWLGSSGVVLAPRRVYVGSDAVAVLVDATAAGGFAVPTEVHRPMVVRLQVGSDGVREMAAGWPSADRALWDASIAGQDPARDERFAGLESTVARMTDAWSMGAVGDAGALYTDDALHRDVVGLDRAGRSWLLADVEARRTFGGATVALDAAAATAAGWSPASAPVFVSLVAPASAGDGLVPFGHPIVWTALAVTGGDGCARHALIEWHLGARGVEGEDVLWDVGDLRSCGAPSGVALPGGWWDGLRAPSFTPVPTGTVLTAAGQAIEVDNAGADQLRLATYGVRRFEALGLAVPLVRTVVFPPSDACRGRAGAAVTEPAGNVLFLCYDAAAICAPDPAPCSRLALSPRRTMLHELAHLWESSHVDDATRAAFQRLRGAPVWIDPSGAGQWADQGSEQAAEILAWGLIDEPIRLARLQHTDCDELAAAFRLLTGIEPEAAHRWCAASATAGLG